MCLFFRFKKQNTNAVQFPSDRRYDITDVTAGFGPDDYMRKNKALEARFSAISPDNCPSFTNITGTMIDSSLRFKELFDIASSMVA